MKPIELKFRHDKFDFEQVYREGLWCIYRQTKPGTQIERFEVVRLKIAPAHTFPNGITTPERESYPSSQEWGVRGWTCWDLEAAHKRLQKQLSLAESDAKDASEGKISTDTAQ